MSALLRRLGALGDVLWPPRCAACGERAWSEGRLCAPCAIRLPGPRPRCRRCGRLTGAGAASDPCAGCVDEDLRLDGVVTAWSYEDVPRRLVLALKYHARLEALPVLVAALGAAALAAGVPGDLVVPVPLSTRRRRERGYDQAALLARGLGRALGLEVRPRALLRRRYTPPQTTLPAARRRTSVRGAFRARPKGLRARSVLLVDDVLTTGGTLRAAATALRRAAVASVVAVVACRTERSR